MTLSKTEFLLIGYKELFYQKNVKSHDFKQGKSISLQKWVTFDLY